MNLLITGAGGQVGRELALRLGGGDLALDRAALDLTDAAAVGATLAHHRPRVVINAAAYTAVDQAEQDPEAANAINAAAVAHLAAACAAVGAVLIHLSTDYVFDGTAAMPYTDDQPAAPLGVYGASKWAGEQALRAALPQHLILRVSWVFGQFGHNFVKTMLRVGRDRDLLKVVADQRGGPTAAADIADTLMSLARRAAQAEALPWGTYHYAGQPFVSWHGFAEAIFAEAVAAGVLDRAPQVQAISTAEYPTPAKRPAQSSLDMQRSVAQLGLQPPDWRASLHTLMQDLKAS
ncbi:dTDP-4-dehydrorhamnose reductase [Flagellatimonas centrodinii]|uniref:dTDP-4-dehydrorhamnose reductase n=1 Tax=Flagellatimonas centrodinii TaxID=2806210 RepID=UPI001FF06AD5|nr:dTDP-4-dehydrorhamnose reductase [Flagellatimonas centrodinii]ULQ45284.1 dTDP-4-dehydrorhamnose reductase [Flagellatimonas centrodinii]